MLDEVAAPHKAMLVATKKLQAGVGDVAKQLVAHSTPVEIEFSKLARLRKAVLGAARQAPRDAAARARTL